jgi:hypothetical protein
MSEDAILERLNRIEVLIARTHGNRLTRAEMCERLRVSGKTLTDRVRCHQVPPPFLDGTWLLFRVLEWEWLLEVKRRSFVVRPRAYHLYRHFDEAGKLLYVGISLNAVSRLVGHKSNSPWIWSVARVEVETFPTRGEAEAAEREAIRAERPLFNSTHGDKALRNHALGQL